METVNRREGTLTIVKDMAIKNGSEVVIFHTQTIQAKIYWKDHPAIANVTSGTISEYAKNIEKEPARFFENILISDSSSAKDIVERVSLYFTGTDIPLIKRTSPGDPTSEILKQAELDSDIDVIIINTHGMSVTRRFLLGSITNKIVHHSKVPILVMR